MNQKCYNKIHQSANKVIKPFSFTRFFFSGKQYLISLLFVFCWVFFLVKLLLESLLSAASWEEVDGILYHRSATITRKKCRVRVASYIFWWDMFFINFTFIYFFWAPFFFFCLMLFYLTTWFLFPLDIVSSFIFHLVSGFLVVSGPFLNAASVGYRE